MKNLAWRIKQGISVLDQYNGSTPLALFLKSFFKSQKRFGRRDRAEISEVVFSYFRAGMLRQSLDMAQTIAAGYYLSNDCNENSLQTVNTTLGKGAALMETHSAQDKLEQLGAWLGEHPQLLPPLTLSEGIDHAKWQTDFLSQPHAFIRVLKDLPSVLEELDENNIEYLSINDKCLRVPADSKLNDFNTLKRGAFYIQDYASQEVVKFMEAGPDEFWWDACAGGGGKSLLFVDKNPHTQLMASDVRKTVLQNHNRRLQHHGFAPVPTKVLDLSQPVEAPAEQAFDGILLDVPCTGSGTWARNPERATYFDEALLQSFTQKQKRIIDHSTQWLKPGGTLLYITCSVFKAENEEQIAYLCNELGFTLQQQETLTGFAYNADHLFAARLTSPND